MVVIATAPVMDDRLDARAPTPLSETRRNLKIGGCSGVFSQLLDWSRVLVGCKSPVRRFLVPDVADFPSPGDVGIDNCPTAKQIQRNYATQAGPYGREAAAHERKESVEVSLAQLAGLNVVAMISSRGDPETPKKLRQLLHVKQEPFVLQESLQAIGQPLKKRGADARVRTCMKADQNGWQRKRSQKLKKIKFCESRKYEGDEGQSAKGLKQPKPCAERIKRGPAESILATPSSPLWAQFVKQSVLSPTKSSSKSGSPAKSPEKSPNKKALLLEAAAKILDGSNRSRKPLATMRSLLVEMESRHALLEVTTTIKKSYKSKLLQKPSPLDYSVESKLREEGPFEEKRCKNDEKKRICLANGSKSKPSCRGTEDGGKDHGTFGTKKFAQRLDKDSNSQSKVFPYDRSLNSSGKTSASLASPGESVQHTNSWSQPSVEIDFFCSSLFGSAKEKKSGDAGDTMDSTTKEAEDASMRSSLEGNATAENLSASRNAEGRRNVAMLLPDATPSDDHIVEHDAFGSGTLNSGTRLSGGESPIHMSENTANYSEHLPSYPKSDGSSFANVPSEPSDTGGQLLQTNQCMESANLDYKICEHFVSDTNFQGKQISSEGSEESETFVSHESSTQCGKDDGFWGDLQHVYSDTVSMGMEWMHTDSDNMLSLSCLPLSLDLSRDIDDEGSSRQVGLHDSGRLDGSLLVGNFPTMLKLCDFSWWERENNHGRNFNVEEEDQQIYQDDSFESFDQSPQDSEEDTSSETSITTHRSPPHPLEVFGDERDDTILEEESPLMAVYSTCMDEFEHSSPMSILDASFEPDSPTLDKSLACFQDARHKLLENVRRYELLAQMDLETLLNYTEVDSSVEEEEEPGGLVLETVGNEEMDAANEPTVTNQGESEISSVVSRNADSMLNKGEEDAEHVEGRQLDHRDESMVWCFEQINLIPHCHFNTEGQVKLLQEAEEDIQPSKCTGRRVDSIERLKEGQRLSCKIFFDCVTEATDFLASGVPNYIIEAHAWTKLPKDLLQELKRPVFSLTKCLVDTLLERDTRCARGRWRDISKEVEEVGTEIESTLFGLLMHELLTELSEGL